MSTKPRFSQYIIFVFVLLSLIYTVESVCNKPRIRRAWSELTLQEQHRYIKAITMAYESGRFEQMSEIHINSINFMYAHHNSGFFPWHRWFVFIMENYLRALGPEFECLTIPYWDWEYHNGDPTTATHVLNPGYFGTIGTEETGGCVRDGFFVDWSPGGSCVRRTWDGNFTVVSQKRLADIMVSFSNYGIDAHGFRSNFESAPHSNVHNWIGGNMGSSLSTYDPIFYLHHSNVDRLWSMWQDCHDYDKIPVEELGFPHYAGTTPGFNGIDEVIPYGSHHMKELITPRSIFHISGNKMLKMEYEYSRTRYPGLINQNRKKGCNWDWFPVSWPTVRAKPSRKLYEAVAKVQTKVEDECEDKGHINLKAAEAVNEHEIDGYLHLSNDLFFGYYGPYNSEQIVGIRFFLDIPKDVSISSARILLQADRKATDPLYLKIQIEDSVNSDIFTMKKTISDREVAKQKILWTIDSPWERNSTVATPNIAQLLQKIVDIPNWAPGNSVAIIIRGIQAHIPDFRVVLSDLNSIRLVVDYCHF